MARFRRSKKMFRKKRVMRRKGYKTNSNLKSLNPIAQRYICKMKYAEVIASAIGGGTYGVARMNLNSIYDPNQGLGGHQPYSHDQLQVLYNRYRVIACSYRISATTADGSPVQVGVLPTNEVFTPSTVSEARENPRAKYVLQAGSGADIKPISGKVYIPSLVGRTKSQYMADDRYQATFGSSPGELALLNIFAGTLTELSSLTTVYFNVELEYTVECFDVKTLAQS